MDKDEIERLVRQANAKLPYDDGIINVWDGKTEIQVIKNGELTEYGKLRAKQNAKSNRDIQD